MGIEFYGGEENPAAISKLKSIDTTNFNSSNKDKKLIYL